MQLTIPSLRRTQTPTKRSKNCTKSRTKGEELKLKQQHAAEGKSESFGSKVSEDSQKAWHKTKEGTEKGWDATKEGAEKGWNKTKEGASELEKKVTE